MFGYPAAFIHGNMVCGLFQDSVVARLGKDGAAKVIAEEGATQFAPMAGRSMTGYVVVPSADAESPTTLGPWLLKALEYALTLPPKSSATSAKKVASAKPARQARR
ncbi:MAG: TfoX/Sxy family protein [Candidatus Accumulibacter sp.]|nr:TfoX/Sxy family protein [Accumulibacter sp.]